MEGLQNKAATISLTWMSATPQKGSSTLKLGNRPDQQQSPLPVQAGLRARPRLDWRLCLCLCSRTPQMAKSPKPEVSFDIFDCHNVPGTILAAGAIFSSYAWTHRKSIN